MILSSLGVSPGEALLAPQGSTPGAVFLSTPLTDDYGLQRTITDSFKAVLGRIPGQIRQANGHTYGGVSEMSLWLARVKEAIPLERRARSNVMTWLQEQLQASQEFQDMNAPKVDPSATVAVPPPQTGSGLGGKLLLFGGLGLAAFLAMRFLK